MSQTDSVLNSYSRAKEIYAGLGVNTDLALALLKALPISVHCWQADDIAGFETDKKGLDGGIQVTGNYAGAARTINELQADLEFAFSLVPGVQKVNLHAIYGDFGGQYIDRDQITIDHFQSWIEWAKEINIGLDFNATCFSHPKAADGFTLSNRDPEIRNFWIEHVKRCREIAAFIGQETGHCCIHNLWIPDGSKDRTVSRFAHREWLQDSLDKIYDVRYPSEFMKDAVESKLFGIGSEAMVVGSHDFYLGYAIKNQKMICLDNGHFHPTEQVGDKVSSVLQFLPEVLLHLTRGMRWDSDHVVTLNDEVIMIAHEIIRSKALDRVHIALDYFDASINRLGAYVTGIRAAQKALLVALLEPVELLKDYEKEGKLFERLAMMEEMKTMPFADVWAYWCVKEGVKPGPGWIAEIQRYETKVLSKR